MKKIILLFIIYCITSGCATKSKIVEKTNFAINEPLLMIADNQFHNVYTDPSFQGSSIADVIEVAIRPVQLNLFAQDLVTYALKDELNDSPNRIIHLGDALNIASTYEWREFEKNMNNLNSSGWVMIPGNHDCYFYGNFAGKPDSENGLCGRSDWVDGANSTGLQEGEIVDDPFTKVIFIIYYLDALSKNPLKGFPNRNSISTIYKDNKIYEDKEIKKNVLMKEFKWENKDPEAFVKRIEGYYSDHKSDYWKSFIVQELSVGFKDGKLKSMILLDTTNYNNLPASKFFHCLINYTPFYKYIPFIKKRYLAGLTGEISESQRNIVDKWTNPEEEKDYILIGHHPFHSLTPKSQEWIAEKGKYYISAHTHDPQILKKKYEKEFNIGSIVDTPIEMPKKVQECKISPQYAKMEVDGTIKINCETADKVFSEVAGKKAPDKFKERGFDHYLKHQDMDLYDGLFDNKITVHRNQLNALVKIYLEMFTALNPKKYEAFKTSKSQNPDLYKDFNKIICKLNNFEPIKNKDDIKECVALLKDCEKMDDSLKQLLELEQYFDDRQLYGSWEGIQASLSEARYKIIKKVSKKKKDDTYIVRKLSRFERFKSFFKRVL